MSWEGGEWEESCGCNKISCPKVLNYELLVFRTVYGSDKEIRDKERPKNRAGHMDNLRDLLGIRSMDRVPNGWITKL